MVLHAAFGASTNLLLHLPAVAHAAGLRRPTVEDWQRINRQVPRLVDVLPNGPRQFKTVQVFMAGGVPEVMLHLRDLGLLKLEAQTVTGRTIGKQLEAWESSARRRRFREHLQARDGVEPDHVILAPEAAERAGLSRTLIFPTGNLAPEGSVVKATAIDPSLFDRNVYRHRGRARVFTSEAAAIEAVRSSGADKLQADQILVLLCRGPRGAGMPETAQITIALKYTEALKNIPLITDGRFSGFSSGPCLGHLGPEALEGGPVGKLLDGDWLEIVLDTGSMSGSIHLLGDRSTEQKALGVETGNRLLAERAPRKDLAADPDLPADVKLWAALQATGGGVWGGCVVDERAVALMQRARFGRMVLEGYRGGCVVDVQKVCERLKV